MSTHQFVTVTTRQDSADTSLNNRRLADRVEDLNHYGSRGFAHVSTVTVPDTDGLTIIDTLGRQL